MSIPPSTPTPGGYYAAPPPPKSSSGGCWKAVGLGCGAIFLLALIGGILAVRNVKNQIDHPTRGSIIGTIAAAGKAGLEGAEIQKAVADYHRQHGKYPPSLMKMVQEGSLDGKNLHNDLDDNPNPGHISWIYHQPEEGAPDTTPLLEEPYHLTIGGKTQPARLVILLNGRNASSASPRQSQ